MYAMFPEKPVRYLAHVWNLANRIFSSFITGQCIEAVILGSMFFVSMTILHFPYAMLVGVLISFTALIPLFGGIIGCWVAFFLILMISPVKAVLFLGLFPYPAADRRKPDLSSCGRWFCRASIHLGTGSCNTWRQSDGNCGNADLHSDSICDLYTFQRVGICPS